MTKLVRLVPGGRRGKPWRRSGTHPPPSRPPGGFCRHAWAHDNFVDLLEHLLLDRSQVAVKGVRNGDAAQLAAAPCALPPPLQMLCLRRVHLIASHTPAKCSLSVGAAPSADLRPWVRVSPRRLTATSAPYWRSVQRSACECKLENQLGTPATMCKGEAGAPARHACDHVQGRLCRQHEIYICTCTCACKEGCTPYARKAVISHIQGRPESQRGMPVIGWALSGGLGRSSTCGVFGWTRG